VVGQVHEAGEALAQAHGVDDGEPHAAGRDGGEEARHHHLERADGVVAHGPVGLHEQRRLPREPEGRGHRERLGQVQAHPVAVPVAARSSGRVPAAVAAEARVAGDGVGDLLEVHAQLAEADRLRELGGWSPLPPRRVVPRPGVGDRATPVAGDGRADVGQPLVQPPLQRRAGGLVTGPAVAVVLLVTLRGRRQVALAAALQLGQVALELLVGLLAAPAPLLGLGGEALAVLGPDGLQALVALPGRPLDDRQEMVPRPLHLHVAPLPRLGEPPLADGLGELVLRLDRLPRGGERLAERLLLPDHLPLCEEAQEQEGGRHHRQHRPRDDADDLPVGVRVAGAPVRVRRGREDDE
jgi:hypothetical protein